MFRPGDKILCLESSGGSGEHRPAYIKGQTYVVKNFNKSKYGDGIIETVLDSKGSTSNAWNAKYFKLIRKEKNLPNWW